LTEQIYNIYVYFWVVVGITVLSWMVVLVEPFIVCPYFGFDSVKCLDPSRDRLEVSLIALITSLDVFTDILSKPQPPHIHLPHLSRLSQIRYHLLSPSPSLTNWQ